MSMNTSSSMPRLRRVSAPRGWSKYPLMLLAASLIALGTGARAAVVTFGPVASLADDSSGGEILTSGVYQFGWNSGDTATDVTVNGVTFYGNPVQSTPSGVTITHDADGSVTGENGGLGYTGDFSTLMSSLLYSENELVSGSFALQINGLKVGQKYRVQFFSLWNGTGVGARDMQIESGEPGTGYFDAEVSGKTTIATFTADATSQAFNLKALGFEDRSVLNGMTVFSVPEPQLTREPQ